MIAWLRKRWWLVVLIIGLFFLGKGHFGGGAEVTEANRPVKEFFVHARRFEYTPNRINVNKGDRVIIHLVSEDVHHGFYLDGYEIQTSAAPGRSGILNFVADNTGRYSYRCSVTCGPFHPYMIGYFTVGPNTRFYSGAGIVLLIGLGVVFLLLRGKEPRS